MSGLLLRTTVRTSFRLYRIGASTSPLLPPFSVCREGTKGENEEDYTEIGNVNSENFMRGEVRGCNLFSEPVWAGRGRNVWRTKSTELLLPAGLSIAYATDTPFTAMQTIVCAENQTMPHKDYLKALVDMEDQFVLCEIDELRTEFEKHNLEIPEVADPSVNSGEVCSLYEARDPVSVLLNFAWWRCQNWYKTRGVLSRLEEPNDIPLMEIMLRFVRNNRTEVKYEDFLAASPQSAFFRNSPAVADRLIPQWMPFLQKATRARLLKMEREEEHLRTKCDGKWPHHGLFFREHTQMRENIRWFETAFKDLLSSGRPIL